MFIIPDRSLPAVLLTLLLALAFGAWGGLRPVPLDQGSASSVGTRGSIDRAVAVGSAMASPVAPADGGPEPRAPGRAGVPIGEPVPSTG